jgi:hypothetical protein
MDNTTILTFKAIVGFISDLNSEFGDKYKSIALYNRLLDKTGIINVGPINKHIDCFRSFFEKNKSGMESKDIEQFQDTKISYSQNVYVDVALILKQSNTDSSSIIWKHLLTIWGLIDPTSQAKRILHESMKASNGTDKESEFLSNILERVEKSVNEQGPDNSNPMSTIASLMNSGVFTDLINGMQTGLSDGSLDISKLMGSVQGMMSKMGGGMPSGAGAGGMPDLSAVMGMMGAMGGGGAASAAGSGGAGGMPDLSAMMGMMSAFTGGSGCAGAGGMPDLSAVMGMMSGMGLNAGNGGNTSSSTSSSHKNLTIEEDTSSSSNDAKSKKD